MLNNFIDPRKIKIEDGRPMVDDGGLLPVGIQDWARSKFSEERRYILKEPTPGGSGAPTARATPSTSGLILKRSSYLHRAVRTFSTRFMTVKVLTVGRLIAELRSNTTQGKISTTVSKLRRET